MSKKDTTQQDEKKELQNPEVQKDNTPTDVLDGNKDIPTLLTQVDALLNKTYLPMLSQLDIISLDNEEISFTKINSNIRFFELTRIVLNKNENMRDKLVTVFNAVGTSDSSFIYIINGKGEEVSIYLGVKGNQSNFFDEDNKDKNEDNKDKIDSYTKTYKAQKILESGIKGNFFAVGYTLCQFYLIGFVLCFKFCHCLFL